MSLTRVGRRMAEAAYARRLLRLRIAAQVTCAASRSYGRSDVVAPRRCRCRRGWPIRHENHRDTSSRNCASAIAVFATFHSRCRSTSGDLVCRHIALVILSDHGLIHLSSLKIVAFPAAVTSRPVANGLSLITISRSKL